MFYGGERNVPGAPGNLFAGGQSVTVGIPGEFSDLVYRGGPAEVMPLPYYGGGLVVEQLAGGNFMGGQGSAINPETFKRDARQQKIYNKGVNTDNPNEKEIFLQRTGPQLPFASFPGAIGNMGGLMSQGLPPGFIGKQVS